MNRLAYTAVPILAFIVLGIGIRSDAAQITPTPLPSDYALLPTLQALMLDNAACNLPCFWGLQPGQTSLTEFEDFSQTTFHKLFSEYAYETTTPNARVWRSLFFDLNDDSTGNNALDGVFTFEDNILSVTHISINNPPEWLPDNPYWLQDMLNNMNTTPEIYVAVHTSTGIIPLVLVYPNLGVMVSYTFMLRVEGNVVSPIVDKPLLLCGHPENTERIELWLQNSDNEQSVGKLLPGLEDASSSIMGRFYLPVEEMTGFDAETFVQAIVNHPDQCIEVLSIHDLREQGYGY